MAQITDKKLSPTDKMADKMTEIMRGRHGCQELLKVTKVYG